MIAGVDNTNEHTEALIRTCFRTTCSEVTIMLVNENKRERERERERERVREREIVHTMWTIIHVGNSHLKLNLTITMYQRQLQISQ